MSERKADPAAAAGTPRDDATERPGTSTESLSIDVDVDGAATLRTSALYRRPAAATALFVFGHGAGAGMEHAFMARVADGLAERGVASLRYQFPSMERGAKRVDPPPVAHATVRAAVTAATRLDPALPLFAGGKSFGGRMTSGAHAAAALAGVRGLVFVGFPLHPAGAPATTRAAHLSKVDVPMLFLQGTRDALADLALLAPVVSALGPRATLVRFEGADHGFGVLKRSGTTDDAVRAALMDAMVAWMAGVPARA